MNNKKLEKIQHILSQIVAEMYNYGHFMSDERVEKLMKEIRDLLK